MDENHGRAMPTRSLTAASGAFLALLGLLGQGCGRPGAPDTQPVILSIDGPSIDTAPTSAAADGPTVHLAGFPRGNDYTAEPQPLPALVAPGEMALPFAENPPSYPNTGYSEVTPLIVPADSRPLQAEEIPYPQVLGDASPVITPPSTLPTYEIPRVATAPAPRMQAPPPAANPSPLVPRKSASVNAAELATSRRTADESIRKGFALYARGATYSARAEFMAALRTIAQGLDNQETTSRHSQALIAGLRTIREIEDFYGRGDRIEPALPLAVIIASHQTPVLKDAPADGLLPSAAINAYQRFAQMQLTEALGTEALGSMGLFAVGKVQAGYEKIASSENALNSLRAATYFRAALLVEPNNFLAANDLGVLLAKQGRFEEACEIFQTSVAVAPQPVTWENLAMVHQKLGEGSLAQQAQQEAQLARYTTKVPSQHNFVSWLDVTSFAQMTNTSSGDLNPPANGKAVDGVKSVAGQKGTTTRN